MVQGWPGLRHVKSNSKQPTTPAHPHPNPTLQTAPEPLDRKRTSLQSLTLLVRAHKNVSDPSLLSLPAKQPASNIIHYPPPPPSRHRSRPASFDPCSRFSPHHNGASPIFAPITSLTPSCRAGSLGEAASWAAAKASRLPSLPPEFQGQRAPMRRPTPAPCPCPTHRSLFLRPHRARPCRTLVPRI